ncbi:MAG: P-loop NTPase [Sulfolobales archaeon]|nr:P-loop NTPase [Sulfolobales archaeon]MCX8209305.1 P-loop NTPase [Sulfolobales archaeon]MDW8010604.1 P-loop NTPase [Sulfolobales archaeon]
MKYFEDPRVGAIQLRLKDVREVLVFAGSKGGVGKTLISVLTSLLLSRRGFRVGLFDMDITNPTSHVTLGVDLRSVKPTEEKGVVPPEVSGVTFMSPVFYTLDRPTPLRGEYVSSALRELLSITRWPGIDVLVLDMPPGMSDELLELLTHIRRFRAMLVTTPSPMAVASSIRLAEVLSGRLEAVVLNMVTESAFGAEKLLNYAPGIPVYEVPYDSDVEYSIGYPEKLVLTRAAREVDRQVVDHVARLLRT